MSGMSDEILRPDQTPKGNVHNVGTTGSLLSAIGVTLLALTKLGAAMAVTVWAMVKLFGLPDYVLYGLLVLGAVPVLWAVIWTAGRAWHVENRLGRGLDVDTPVFNLMHYWKKR